MEEDRGHFWRNCRGGDRVVFFAYGDRRFFNAEAGSVSRISSAGRIRVRGRDDDSTDLADGAQRHRALGRFTMVIYCVLFVTGSITYTMLYILVSREDWVTVESADLRLRSMDAYGGD